VSDYNLDYEFRRIESRDWTDSGVSLHGPGVRVAAKHTFDFS